MSNEVMLNIRPGFFYLFQRIFVRPLGAKNDIGSTDKFRIGSLRPKSGK